MNSIIEFCIFELGQMPYFQLLWHFQANQERIDHLWHSQTTWKTHKEKCYGTSRPRELTKMQKLLESKNKNKNENENQNENKNENSFLFSLSCLFLFSFSFLFLFSFSFLCSFSLLLFSFWLLLLFFTFVFVFAFLNFYRTSRPPLGQHEFGSFSSHLS